MIDLQALFLSIDRNMGEVEDDIASLRAAGNRAAAAHLTLKLVAAKQAFINGIGAEAERERQRERIERIERAILDRHLRRLPGAEPEWPRPRTVGDLIEAAQRSAQP